MASWKMCKTTRAKKAHTNRYPWWLGTLVMGSVHSTSRPLRIVGEHPGTSWGARRAPYERCNPPAGWKPCCWRKTAAVSQNTLWKTPLSSAHLSLPLLEELFSIDSERDWQGLAVRLNTCTVVTDKPQERLRQQTKHLNYDSNTWPACCCASFRNTQLLKPKQLSCQSHILPVNEGDCEWMDPLFSMAIIWPTKSLGMKLANGKISVLISWTT